MLVEAQDTALATALSDLSIPEQHQICAADLGSRWMLVLGTSAGDLTGIVAEDFGCNDVLLTDDPFSTPPGEAEQPGTPPGRLTNGLAVVRELARASGRGQPRAQPRSAG